MRTCLLAFALALVAAALATLLSRAAGLRFGVVDQPDAFRKVHRRPIPRVGGAGVFAGFLVAVLFFLHVYPRLHGGAPGFLGQLSPAEEWGLIGGALVAFATGLYDDVRGLRPRWKLLCQALAGLVAWAAGYSIPGVTNPLGGSAVSLGVLALPLTLFWFVACMNAVNLLDGLDGLAAGVCLFVCMTLMLTCVHMGKWTDAFLLTCFGGALLGFLLFNFHPASIFLGDCGSLLLGFLVAALSLRGARKAETAVALLIPIIALGVPIFDSTLAILRRWAKRLPISAADRQHIHHTLLSLGLSHKRVVLTLYAVCVILGVAAFSIAVGRGEGVIIVMGALAVVAFVCMRMFGGVRVRDLWTRLRQDRESRLRSDEARVAVEHGLHRMASASALDDLWAAFCETAEALGLDQASLAFDGAGGRRMDWRRPGCEDAGGEGDEWAAELRIDGDGVAAALAVVRLAPAPGRGLGAMLIRQAAIAPGQMRAAVTSLARKVQTPAALPAYARYCPILPELPELMDRLRSVMAASLSRLARRGA